MLLVAGNRLRVFLLVHVNLKFLGAQSADYYRWIMICFSMSARERKVGRIVPD
jgi:hypothetical protein